MSETLLAFDVGARRIGVAVGNDLLRRAQALEIVRVDGRDDGLTSIAALVDEWKPQRLVVGIPFVLDDAPPSAAQKRCERFASTVARRFALPVERVDERYSSLDADAAHRERRQAGVAKRARDLDDVAAEVILQRWFDALPVGANA
jgi:putative holliday junction resolvase